MRPIADSLHQAVLDRIVITIIDVVAEIVVVADIVFPKPALLDATLAFVLSYGAHPLGFRQRLGEAVLDEAHPGGKIGFAGRKGQNRVQVIRQDHESFDAERVSPLGARDCHFQQPDIRGQKFCPALKQVHREEV